LRWRSVPIERLALRELDGEVVIRNDITGSTHLLEPLAAEVLRTLASKAEGLSTNELAAQLAGRYEAEEDWSKSIEAILSDFLRLGLAAPSD
jgi:PqqD family protein of HPr-rel-A system